LFAFIALRLATLRDILRVFIRLIRFNQSLYKTQLTLGVSRLFRSRQQTANEQNAKEKINKKSGVRRFSTQHRVGDGEKDDMQGSITPAPGRVLFGCDGSDLMVARAFWGTAGGTLTRKEKKTIVNILYEWIKKS
jgi:hypothetical protein